LAENEALLKKNIVKVDKVSLKEKIIPIIKQKPNRKVLGLFRFHLGVYNFANRGKPTKFKNWLKRAIGEEPVLLDTALTARSLKQIKQFMENSGYFNAEVYDSTIYITKHKAKVIYHITTNAPYTINSFSFSIKNPVIDSLVNAENINTLIHAGDIYDKEVIQKERERITSVLKNNGFYAFNQQYIAFKVDSSLKSKKVNIFMTVSNLNENQKDTSSTEKNADHIQYTINKVFIRTDFDPLSISDKVTLDTVLFNDYQIIATSQNIAYRSAPLVKNVFFKPGELYHLRDHENTYRALGDLGNFRFINIKFETDTEALKQNENKLNCFIMLTPLSKQSYKIELEGTHNGGNLGVGGNVTYSNKNTFRGGETFDLKLKFSLEDLKNTTIPETKNILWFNTYEFGPEAKLRIPRVVSLFRSKDKSVISSTEITTSYSTEQRPEFFRTNALISGGVVLRYSNRFRVSYYPAEINFVTVNLEPTFAQDLEDIGDPALTDSYEDHLITDGRASLTFTTQELNKHRNFYFVYFALETAGNTLRALDWLKARMNGTSLNRDSSYTYFGNNYAQYIKPEADLRYYYVPDEHNTIVFRVSGGIGIPYLNSISLPFEKSFFAGGSNDLRAFYARGIGPGSYHDVNIQQTGEIKINSNIEYRFDIVKILQGAFFIDAGNVWLTYNDPNRPGSKFEWDRFYKELAIGGGFGFRFNFTFFIFRFDLGYKFRDPSLPEGQRWVIKDLQLFNGFIGNFGIGFPF
jgi:outer membrane protein assembly factor BamA